MNNWLLMGALVALCAPVFLLVKIALVDISPLTFAAARLVIAAIVSFAALRIAGPIEPIDRSVWPRFLVMGAINSALPMAIIAIAQTQIDSGLVSILNGAIPIPTAILAHWFAEERLTLRKGTGVLVGFAGLVLIFLVNLLDGVPASALGTGLVLLATLSYAVASVYARRQLRGHSMRLAAAAQCACGAMLLLPLALVAEPLPSGLPGLSSLAALLVLGGIVTPLVYAIYYTLIERAGPTFVMMSTYLTPPMGAALGVVVLGESLGWNAVAGCALVLSGVVLATRQATVATASPNVLVWRSPSPREPSDDSRRGKQMW